MFISWAHSQVGISAGTVGANAPRIGAIETSDVFRLKTLLEQSQDRVAKLTILLCEADHRIKNSLQIATSITQAEARRTEIDDVREALIRAASRIQAISTVHEALQAAGGESTLDVGHLIEIMCDSMRDLCDGKAELSFDHGSASLTVPVTFARTLAILVNELIVNSLQHAFPEDRPGIISVSLKHVGKDILVVVKDDGIGLETTNSGHTGFGTDLIEMMVRQIGGKLVSEGTSGSCFKLKAPVPLSPAQATPSVAPFSFA